MSEEDRRRRREGVLSRMFVESRRTKEAFRRIDDLVNEGWEEENCIALLMLGPSRAGKTRLVKEYRLLRSRPEEQGGMGLKIVRVEAPPNCTLRSFASDFLKQLGDPDPEYGSEHEMTQRIVERAEEAAPDLIIVDELQRLIDADTDRVKRTVANWVTALLNKRICPLLLIGEPSTVRVFEAVTRAQVMHAQGRTMGQLTVDRYDWADETDQKEFRAFIHMVEKELGLPEPSNLARIDTALRIYVFAQGLVGEAVRLLAQGRRVARAKGRPCLSHEVLAQAVDELRIGEARNAPNPFRVASVTLASLGAEEPEMEKPRGKKGRKAA